jgi:hypothetical protein
MDVTLDYDKRFTVWIHDVPSEFCRTVKVDVLHSEGLAPHIRIGNLEIILMEQRTPAYPLKRDDLKTALCTDELKDELKDACDEKD